MTTPRISFILPCYKKAALFAAAWPLNPAFREADTEVVIVLDEPHDERYFTEFAKREQHARVRLLVNSEPHPWRPPSIPINVGIRHALGQFVVIMSPETILDMPAAGYLSYKIRAGTMLMGMLWNVSGWNSSMNLFDLWHRIRHVEITNSPGIGFGFFCVERCAFDAIGGMNEAQDHYGRDDDAIRIRLVRFGITGIVDPLIKAFHIWHGGTDRITPPADVMPPAVVYTHQHDWGFNSDFRTVFDWRTP